MLGTVTRAGRLLDLFTPERPEWGPTAASRELGIAKSQAYELLTSLTAIGLLRRSRAGQFRLGWRTLSLGRDVLRSQFPKPAFRVMAGLARTFGEPVHLVAFDRDQLTIIAHHPGVRGTDALVPRSSANAYAHASAMGKALLSSLHPEELEARLPEHLPAHTARTILSHQALKDELEQIRVERVAFDRGEVADQLRAVAVPLCDASTETVAALGVWALEDRWATLRPEMTRAVTGAGHRMELLMRALSEPDPADAAVAV